ncbi:putative ATP-dependent protease subunit C (ClpC), partial [Reticulomyxa filosa]
FQERKDKISNKQEEKEDSDHKIREEDEKWSNTMDYSLLYDDKKESIELEDIWKRTNEENGLKLRHVSIHGEAGTGKSVLSQRIAYLWANKQMWNDKFQFLLHIPLRKIVDKTTDKNDDDIEKQWLKIMKELNIPQWNADDTKCVMDEKNELLLVLDGLDEIANELNTKPGLQKWLEDCALNTNYSIIMTSRPNATCSYLNKKLRRLNVIGFQKEDIQDYVHGYFRNITNNNNNHQADSLIEILNNNQNLKLLSHTPLYLRLFCYLARQEIHELNEINEMKEEKKGNEIEDKIFNGLNNVSISKLYKKLLECYMRWNWTKSNEMKEKINLQNMFNIFEMEIDYLSHLAWEGTKLGQIIVSCEIQEKSLHWIKKKYPRKCIAIPSQWSRIHSFGFLQGQESMNPSHPINSVYFPHLTFQEWFSAYYL